MGFFKDFKRDFAQAVNELMPDKEELAEEYDDEDMVNTFDDTEKKTIQEDELENLDDYSINTFSDSVEEYEEDMKSLQEEEEEALEEKDGLENIPKAEIIKDDIDDDLDLFSEDEEESQMVTELVVEETYEKNPDANEQGDIMDVDGLDESKEDADEDELKKLDELDEEDMLLDMEDAEALELKKVDEIAEAKLVNTSVNRVDLNKDVLDAMQKREEENENQDDFEEDDMAELEEKINEKQRESVESVLADDTTYITKGTTINGDLETEGGVDIIGKVCGNVTCLGKLIVGGTIKGNISAGELYANAAKLEGEVVVSDSVKIGVGTVVVGNVQAASAVIAGAVNGDIDVKGPVIVDSTAVIMGNIKSRSVQINNGAVIEGFCSQCYSEIDVKSFFE